VINGIDIRVGGVESVLDCLISSSFDSAEGFISSPEKMKNEN
jgi:hypothetical protein